MYYNIPVVVKLKIYIVLINYKYIHMSYMYKIIIYLQYNLLIRFLHLLIVLNLCHDFERSNLDKLIINLKYFKTPIPIIMNVNLITNLLRIQHYFFL